MNYQIIYGWLQGMLDTTKAPLKEMMNQDDVEVLEFVSDKFTELYSVIDKLNRKVDKLSLSFEHSELLFSLPEIDLISHSKLNHVVIPASDPVSLDSNMYQLEGDSGKQYRWLGPKRLTKFTIPIDRSQERSLVLDLLSQAADGLFGSIKIYVDGELVKHEIELAGGSATLFVNLPESSRVQDTVIALFCPKLFKPSELNSETFDSRPISVSFHGLEVV